MVDERRNDLLRWASGHDIDTLADIAYRRATSAIGRHLEGMQRRRMISPVLTGMALHGVLLAILLGAGCTTEEPSRPPTPPTEDPPTDPVAEVVSSLEDLPVDLAVDERYVYWLTATLVPDPHGPPSRRGSVVRWDKSTGERVVLATFADTEPVEIDVSSTYVYWIELGGYLSNGDRYLGHDRLLRIPKTGGTPEVVAAEQWFGDGPADQVAIANGYVYWLSAGSPGDANGAVRRMTEGGALTVVETLASSLDSPTTLAAGSTKLCFRTGVPNYNSPIWCMPAGGGAIVPIAYDRFPYDMLFFDDRLYWSDGGRNDRNTIERAVPDPGTTIETVPSSYWARALAADATALFWTVSSPYSDYGCLHGLVGDTKMRIWEGDTYLHALASDGVHAYFIENERVLRMPARP